MSVDPKISVATVKKELQDCEEDRKRFGWEISKVNEEAQCFTVAMRSPVDNQEFVMEIDFDNYKQWPLLIEFIDSRTGERGTKNAYPAPSGQYGNFFHNHPCICNPCNRKAYTKLGGPHADWDMAGWQQTPQVGSLTNIQAILRAIYSRISNPDVYRGRMNG